MHRHSFKGQLPINFDEEDIPEPSVMEEPVKSNRPAGTSNSLVCLVCLLYLVYYISRDRTVFPFSCTYLIEYGNFNISAILTDELFYFHFSASGFWQQTLSSFDPVMTPSTIIIMLFTIGIIFMPVGISIYLDSISSFEMTYQYGGSGTDAATLAACTSAAVCTKTFTLDEDVESDIYVSYELTNFYQNQIKYQAAVDWLQVMGTSAGTEDECGSDYFTTGNQTYSPCGLIANSFFNDVFGLDYTNSLVNGVAPSSDMKMDAASITTISTDLFSQPTEFASKEITATGTTCSTFTTATCTAQGLAADCRCYAGVSGQAGKFWLYWYPEDATTQYLWESYPNAISPLEGVTSPHFMNWMDIAAFAKFRKLYGVISGPFKKGDSLKFVIDSSYDVDNFDGTKTFVISSHGDLGPANYGIGVVFIVSGIVCLLVSIAFFLKQNFAPRALGSPEILNWKTK